MEPTETNAGNDDDKVLMARLARGDQDALAPLMERHHRRIYRLCMSYLRCHDDAQDAAQETFVKAFQNAARFPMTHEPGRWLSRIAINQSIDQYRRGQRRGRHEAPLAEQDYDPRQATGEPTPEHRLLGAQIGGRIDIALRTLPEKQRAIFVLRHYEGLTLEEIAATLQISLGTVKSSLHRALHHLRGRLEGLRA